MIYLIYRLSFQKQFLLCSTLQSFTLLISYSFRARQISLKHGCPWATTLVAQIRFCSKAYFWCKGWQFKSVQHIPYCTHTSWQYTFVVMSAKATNLERTVLFAQYIFQIHSDFFICQTDTFNIFSVEAPSERLT